MFNFSVNKPNGQSTLFVDGGLQYSVNFDSRGIVSMVIEDGWIILENIVFY